MNKALARDLNLDDDDLLKTITQPIVEVERNDDGPPSSPSDIPLSEAGSLFLLTSRIASATLFGSSSTLPPLFVFPDLAAIAFKFIGQAESGGASSIGTEPEAVVDAVLAIGMFTAHNSKIGDVKYEGDEKFSQFLQVGYLEDDIFTFILICLVNVSVICKHTKSNSTVSSACPHFYRPSLSP